MRHIGMDVHVEFCEVAVHEDGATTKAPRVITSETELRHFGESLRRDDVVAMEATGNAWAIARLLGEYAEVIVADARPLRALSAAKAKTDRTDARALAELAAAGLLRPVWVADDEARALRRVLARRHQLVGQRTRAKNEIHAALHRNLRRSPVSDLFGRRGRAWLSEIELPSFEQHTIESCLRQVDLVDEELTAIDRLVAERAMADERIRRLMTIPGVDATTAAQLVATIGEVSRFPDARKLTSYLGLDPTVRQSGSEPARHGRISKEGAAAARRLLVEAACTATRTPGPLRAFHTRIRARRGAQIAAVATARKLAVLAWHMLSRGEDYAYARPSLTRIKLRRLELRLGADPLTGRRPQVRIYPTGPQRAAERAMLEQAEAGYQRLVRDWRVSRPRT
jgi:transposase